MNACLAKTATDLVRDSTAALPADLRDWISENRAMELALEAVQVVGARSPQFPWQPGESAGRAMVALLAYCYATDLYGSEDIAWAAEEDATIRCICAGNCPNGGTIRRFRRANRQWIEQCLIYVLNQTVAEQLGKVGLDVVVASGVESNLRPQISAWTRRKLELAIMMDAAAAD